MDKMKDIESDENMIDEQAFRNEKKYSEIKFDENGSSSSNSYIFQIDEKKDKVIFENKHISDMESFKNSISKISSPCSYKIKNPELLNELSKGENVHFELSKSFFNSLKIDDIEFVNLNKEKKDKDRTNKIMYFASSLLLTKNENDKSLFDKLHNYLTGFSGASLISDFCYNKNLYYPYSINDYYIGYDRNYSKIFRTHHYYSLFGYGKIIHNFGPKGVGKSLCCRATVFNYLHFRIIKGKEVFFPSIFFDIKILIKNWNNKELILKIIKYEFINLFKDFITWEKSYSEFEKELENYPPSSVFSLIIKFIDFYFSIVIYPLLIIIDHYSYIYDKANELKLIKNICINEKKFVLYILYEVNTREDQKIFVEYLKKSQSVMHEILCEGENLSNQVDLSLSEVACFFGYELRGFPSIYQTIKQEEDKRIKEGISLNLIEAIKIFMKKIPINYLKYFGNNISYYFKYLSSGIKDLEEFVKNVKIEIKKEILSFFENIDSTLKKNKYNILEDILEKAYKEIDKDHYLLDYINSSYFVFHRIKTSTPVKYKYTYAFPLIKINNWIKERIKKFGFMEFSKDNIYSFEIEYLIKKNLTITDMCSKTFAEEEINSGDTLINLKIPMDINKKKCIVIFQNFNAKSIDICFLIKRNNDVENNNFTLNLLRMKCSDSYSINNKLLKYNRYEMTHLKYKLEYIFKINIIESYITYVSLYDIPKKCAEKNRNRFFYFNRKNMTFVDQYNNRIKKFPFYDSCKIEFIHINNILNFIKDFISHIHPDLIINLKETDKKKVIKNKKQINNSAVIEVNKEIIKENIIIRNIRYNFEPKNLYQYECDTYYYIIEIKK